MHMDYMFLNSNGLKKRNEVTEEEAKMSLTVLAAYNSHSKSPFAHAVPHKGAGQDNYAADRITSDIAWLGYPRIILRSDNEPALGQVVTSALKLPRVQVADAKEGQPSAAAEGSTLDHPETNGAIERMVGLVKGQFRAMQMTLEKFVKAKISPRL